MKKYVSGCNPVNFCKCYRLQSWKKISTLINVGRKLLKDWFWYSFYTSWFVLKMPHQSGFRWDLKNYERNHSNNFRIYPLCFFFHKEEGDGWWRYLENMIQSVFDIKKILFTVCISYFNNILSFRFILNTPTISLLWLSKENI